MFNAIYEYMESFIYQEGEIHWSYHLIPYEMVLAQAKERHEKEPYTYSARGSKHKTFGIITL